jgi:alpha,alpha-trehalase
MEGLMRSGQEEIARSMVKNFAYLIDEVGFIPNGNRDYYRGRSQPPFFALMVDLVAGQDRDFYLSMLPAMQKEYDFWMKGVDALQPGEAYKRAVKLSDGTVMNRFFDDHDGPRPESYREDVEIAMLYPESKRPKVYKDLRAGAESGWDYSTRWFKDGKSLETIETTEILPVDLNSLLYFLELKLAQGYNWAGDLDEANFYLEKADERKEGINQYFWDEESKSYVDIYWKNQVRTGKLSMAAAYPLYFNIPEKDRGRTAAKTLSDKLLMPGGFVSTLANSGQQWDYPNGWAPQQWIGVNALFNYDQDKTALEAASRWLARNRQVYQATGKMMEKYNVVDTDLLAGGGEYPLQDGFGWTNGIALAFSEMLKKSEAVK